MHQADAGAHQHAAKSEPLEAGIGALADDLQRHPARQDAGYHRQHGPDRRVGDAAGQRKREHANEMHAPNAASMQIAPALAQAHRAGRELAATIRPEIDRATNAASVATTTESATRPVL